MASRRPSISRRLLLAMILCMPLLLGLTAVAIDSAYHSSLIKAEENRLKAQFFSLLGAVEWDENEGLSTDDRLKEPRFWQFRSGLYADIRGRDGTLLWQSLSADTLQLPTGANTTDSGQEQLGSAEIDGQPFLFYRYQAVWETDSGRDIPLVFSIYSETRSLLNEQAQFRRQLATWLGLVALLSVLLVAIIQYWGLKPLRKLAKDLHRLETGDSDQLSDDYPIELEAITGNLNQLIQKERRQRERYRHTLGDLAHSLKTPLAVLKNERLDESQRSEHIQRMDNIIKYQLRRAVSSGSQQLRRKTPLKPLLNSLKNTLLKVHHGRTINFEIALNDDAAVAIDEQDLLELFGNLLDNACKACQQSVVIHGHRTSHGLVISIEDDGRGLDPDELEVLMDRGRRGDQYAQGQGLGLAIVRDIADSCNITLLFKRRPQGGSCIQLSFPQLKIQL